MYTVTVSSRFRIVIPQAIRDQLHIEVGHKLQVLAYDNRIELLPIESPQPLRGFLLGIETTVLRTDGARS